MYEISSREVAHLIGPTLLVLGCIALAFNVAERFSGPPAPAASNDADTLVLLHQSRSCGSTQAAEIVLVGDSTCLVGVDAVELSRLLPNHPRVINLSLFMWLGLDVYGEEMADFAAANPGAVRTVLLLVTPDKLAAQSDPAANELWRTLHHPNPTVGVHRGWDWTGATLLRNHLLNRILPPPLQGSGAGRFGFLPEIEAYMTAHGGSVLKPGVYTPPRVVTTASSSPLRLAPTTEVESRAFHAKLPKGAKLLAGLTPFPAGLHFTTHDPRYPDLLGRWNRALGADVLLTNLPASLPNECFGPGNHLNEYGQALFTKILAKVLAPSANRDSRTAGELRPAARP